MKNEQMVPRPYETEYRDGETYIYDSRDLNYDAEQEEYVTTEWVSADESGIYDLEEMC